MEYTQFEKGSQTIFDMEGTFTFSDHDKYKHILDLIAAAKSRQIIFKMKNLTFLDSAALGMLLMAKDEAEKARVEIVFTECNEYLRKIFKATKFDTMFAIE